MPQRGTTSPRSYLCAEPIQVSKDILDGIAPKFSNSKQIWLSSFLTNVLDKSNDETLVNMLDSVEAESRNTIAESGMDPRSPVEEIGLNIWVPLVDIGTHWAS